VEIKGNEVPFQALEKLELKDVTESRGTHAKEKQMPRRKGTKFVLFRNKHSAKIIAHQMKKNGCVLCV
jgi:hypothetical protein